MRPGVPKTFVVLCKVADEIETCLTSLLAHWIARPKLRHASGYLLSVASVGSLQTLILLHRRLGEHRRWSQSGHNKGATLTNEVID